MKALLTFLRPEFINRVDEVITFSPLQGDTVRHIAGIMLGDLRDNLKVREIEFSFDDKTLDYVSEKGFDRKFGCPLAEALYPKRGRRQNSADNC